MENSQRCSLKIADFLKRLALFHAVHPVPLNRISNAAIVVSASRGKVIVRIGDTPGGFFVIVYGSVAVALANGKCDRKVVEILGPYQVLGLNVLFSTDPSRTEARALSHSELLFIPRDVVDAELADNPRFAQRLLGYMSDSANRMLTDLEAFTMQSATQRVAGLLIRSMDAASRRGSRTVTLPARKTVVASQLNLSAEHFSRLLRELATSRVISFDGGEVVIQDEEKLRGLLNGHRDASREKKGPRVQRDV